MTLYAFPRALLLASVALALVGCSDGKDDDTAVTTDDTAVTADDTAVTTDDTADTTDDTAVTTDDTAVTTDDTGATTDDTGATTDDTGDTGGPGGPGGDDTGEPVPGGPGGDDTGEPGPGGPGPGGDDTGEPSPGPGPGGDDTGTTSDCTEDDFDFDVEIRDASGAAGTVFTTSDTLGFYGVATNTCSFDVTVRLPNASTGGNLVDSLSVSGPDSGFGMGIGFDGTYIKRTIGAGDSVEELILTDSLDAGDYDVEMGFTIGGGEASTTITVK